MHSTGIVVQNQVERDRTAVACNPQEGIFRVRRDTKPSGSLALAPHSSGHRLERPAERWGRHKDDVAHGIVAVEGNVHGAVGVEGRRWRQVEPPARVLHLHRDGTPRSRRALRDVVREIRRTTVLAVVGHFRGTRAVAPVESRGAPHRLARGIVDLGGAPGVGAVVRIHQQVGAVGGPGGLRVMRFARHRHLPRRGIRSKRGPFGGGVNHS
mmetsp:Transcript_25120/g.65525  ORF Transcript_25120/g.65525 Transcript_25120/m.65525 type:complete len:211 (-) Transcript_25120:290-922(-)